MDAEDVGRRRQDHSPDNRYGPRAQLERGDRCRFCTGDHYVVLVSNGSSGIVSFPSGSNVGGCRSHCTPWADLY